MMEKLSLYGTRTYAGMRLRQRVFSPFLGMSFLIAVFLVPAGFLYLRDGMLLPLVCMVAGTAFYFHVVHLFLHDTLLNDTIPLKVSEEGNAASLLSADIILEMEGRKIHGGDLLRAAANAPRGRFLLRETGLDPTRFLEDCLSQVEATVDVGAFIKAAWQVTKSTGETRVDAPVILSLFFRHIPVCRDALERAGLPEDELDGLLAWEAFHHRFHRKPSPFSAESLRSVSIGRMWVAGYTLALDSLTQEMQVESAAGGERSVVIHHDKIDALLHVLCRSQRNNALITGPMGTGKRRMVENALGILHGLERTQNMPFSRALRLRTDQLLAGTGDPDGAFLYALAKAQDAGRIVLVIRDLALLLKASNARLQTVLLKCLQMPNLSVLAIVDTQDYHGIVKAIPGIDSLFEKIDVRDADDTETMEVLMAHAFSRAHGPRLSYKAARSIQDLCKRFLSSQGGSPAIPLQVYDDAFELALSRKDAVILEEDVRGAVSMKAKMNVQQMSEGERQRLLTIEGTLTKRIVGQEDAVRAVASALKRARLDLHERKKPLGTFLFLGQTGVGKTHTAKVLAEEYFGSADAMIRLDMNEFSHAASVFDIVGSPTSGKEEGFLAQRVQDKPFSLILLDEIEKAHPAVLNLFLQVLDEGTLNDARGVRTDFRNTIIIATSNAGALFIRDVIRKNPTPDIPKLKQDLIDEILRQGAFTPEFLNRFDEVILFRPLTPSIVSSIASLMLGDIVQQIRRKRGIEVQVAPELFAMLIAHGYSAEFGAREMYRTIMTKIEDRLANYLLAHDVKRGEKLVLK